MSAPSRTSGAPTAADRPAPVPSRPRADGRPYATPWVRTLARDLGLDLRAVAHHGTRVHAADLRAADLRAADLRAAAAPRPVPDPTPGPDGPSTGWCAVGLALDVTRWWAAAGRRGGAPARHAVLARALLRAVAAMPAGVPDRLLGVRTSAVAAAAVPEAHELSLHGLTRALRSPVPAPHPAPALVLSVVDDDGPTWEVGPPPAGASLCLHVGAVVRRAAVVDTADGGESFAVRRELAVALSSDGRHTRALLHGLLRAVRDDLCGIDAPRLAAELPDDR